MDINLTLEKCDESFVAHVVVTGQRNAVVQVTVDGKARKPVAVDKAGIASLDLGKFTIGEHVIVATVVGSNPAVTATETIEVKHETEPLGWFWWGLIVLYWLLLWKFGAGWLTATYLGLTFGMFILIAWLKAKFNSSDLLEEFEAVVTNNNWVFKATLAMALATGFAWYLNPLVPEGLLQATWHKAVEFTVGGGNLVDPLEGDGFWGTINHFFFDEVRTFGWRTMTFVYTLCLIPAWMLSYHDETAKQVKQLVKQSGGKGEGPVAFLLKDFLAERLWSLLGIKK